MDGLYERMRLAIFDTETSGFPSPRLLTTIVGFAYIIYNLEGRRVEVECNRIIKQPRNFSIPSAAMSVHGITDELCASNGTHLFPILDTFIDYAITCDNVVGHNVRFDLEMITCAYTQLLNSRKGVEAIELHCLHQLSLIRTVIYPKSICTMKSGIDICRLPRYKGTGFKFPKLRELYEKLVGVSPEIEHDALEDVKSCLACYIKMYDMNTLFVHVV